MPQDRDRRRQFGRVAAGKAAGAGQFQLYNGSRLAANGNVVVVNVTYRIGVFGGFELESLGDGFDDNLCLRDQLAALAWVRDNIAAFGGDPQRVTVFGESAGATSVRRVRMPTQVPRMWSIGAP